MSFLVENGTGVKGATSYATVAFFKAWCADRGYVITAWADADIQAYLVAATDYIDTRWGLEFLGSCKWSTGLYSRSVFTLTDQPSAGETITIGSDVFTFRATATLDGEVEIGETLKETLVNLVLELSEGEHVVDFMLADPDVASLTIFTSHDGVSTTTIVANGSFDVAASSGSSDKKQPRMFPRLYLYDRDGAEVSGVPDKLKDATCAYAYRAKTTVLAPDGSVNNTIRSMTTTVGPISKSVTYAEGAILNPISAFPAADRLLQEYTRSKGVVRN
jgi:hypothetical protein